MEPTPETKWKQKYDAWKQINPHVLPLFIRFAKEVKAAGLDHIGFGTVVERIRWFTDIETKSDPFKLNQNFATYMAREAMATTPELEGMFFLRRLRS